MPTAQLSKTDKKLISQIQGDLPLSRTPFSDLALRLGWEEGEFLRQIRDLKRRGVIRRFGAILRHQIAGYLGNAMVVWKVDPEEIQRVSRAFASFPQVSHCYLRRPQSGWPYNIYTMVHGKRETDCRRIAREMARKTGVKEYRLLFSKREFKKSSMLYFGEKEEQR